MTSPPSIQFVNPSMEAGSGARAPIDSSGLCSMRTFVYLPQSHPFIAFELNCSIFIIMKAVTLILLHNMHLYPYHDVTSHAIIMYCKICMLSSHSFHSCVVSIFSVGNANVGNCSRGLSLKVNIIRFTKRDSFSVNS